MKIKKEYIALAVAIVALVLYLSLRSNDRTHYTLPQFATVDKADISKITFSSAAGDMTLEKKDDVWRIQPQGYPADQSHVDKMLDAVSGFALTTLVSESKSYGQYDLGDDKRITLEAYSGDKLVRKFDIGKTASTYQHTFVRLEDDPRVYQARGNIRQPFDVTADKLRDMVVAKVDKETVGSISMTSAGGSIALRKQGGSPVPPLGGEGDSMPPPPPAPTWRTDDGKQGDETVINRLLGALGSLRCDSYIEGKTKDDFSDPIITISIDAAPPLTLSIFEKREDNKYPAVSSQSDYPFLLAEHVVKQFDKNPADMLAKDTTGGKESPGKPGNTGKPGK
jgi:hypothetical protein